MEHKTPNVTRGFIKGQVNANIYSSIFWPSNREKPPYNPNPAPSTLAPSHANILPQVRAYTAGDKFSETAWSQRISTDPDNTAILVGITVPIIILVLVLLAFVVLRKLHCAPCGKSGGHHGVGRDHPADLVGKHYSFSSHSFIFFLVLSLIGVSLLNHIDNQSKFSPATGY